MINDLKTYVDLCESVEKHGAILLPEGFEWAKQISAQLPNLALDLPTVEKRAKIDLIMDKKNPIFVQLSDGSQLYFSLDEFKRIQGKPERGKTMVLKMLRLPTDKSKMASQIMGCQVI